jgi:putative membrane protein
VAALVPTLLDVIIEPVAIQTGMWHWYGGTPPLQNYLSWYAVSWLLSLAYQRWVGTKVRNPASPLLFILQVVFFLVLGFIR